MIDTVEQVTCKACGSPITQRPGRGHRQREYCNATCRQRAHRAKEQPPASTVTNVTSDEKHALEQRIAQLEQEVETLKALRRKSTRDKLSVLTHHSLQDRFMAVGEKEGYLPLTAQIYVDAGVKAYRSVAKDAPDNVLAALIIAAENRQS